MARKIERKIEKDSFGGRLNEMILKKYGSRNAFYKASGLRGDTTLTWIEGRRHPTIVTLALLCEKLDCSADYLLFGKEQNKDLGE